MSDVSEAREDRTERLVAGLVEDLRPAAPLPRLWISVGIVLAIWSGMVVLVALGTAVPIGARLAVPPIVSRIWILCLCGLVMAAAGGCAAAIAAGRPGQDRLETITTAIAGGGLLVGIASCGIGFALLGAQPSDSLAMDGACLQKGFVIALLPLVVLLPFVLRGWVGRPLVAAAIVLAAGTALGAVITLLGCPAMSPRHVLVGHLDLPILFAVLGAHPLAFALRRIAR